MIKYIGIIALVIYSILALILIINLRKNNNFIRNAFVMLFSLLGVTFLINNQGIVNSCLKYLIRFIYFPTFDSYVLMIFLTICILLYSILKDSLDNKFKIINYIFASFLIVVYVVFMTLKVDVYSYNSLYSESSVFWLRLGTRGFLLWISLLLIIKYCKNFGSKGG